MLAIRGHAGGAPDGPHAELGCPEALPHFKGLRVHKLEHVVLAAGQHSAFAHPHAMSGVTWPVQPADCTLQKLPNAHCQNLAHAVASAHAVVAQAVVV